MQPFFLMEEGLAAFSGEALKQQYRGICAFHTPISA